MDKTPDNADQGSAASHDDFLALLADGPLAESLIRSHVSQLQATTTPALPVTLDSTVDLGNGSSAVISEATPVADLVSIGIAALDAFLQANVTGPVLSPESCAVVENRFTQAWMAYQSGSETKATPNTASSSSVLCKLRKTCLRDLDVDGVSPYPYIPHLELFSFARHIFIHALANHTDKVVHASSPRGTNKYNLTWLKLRIHVWHYKLLTQPSLGSASNFTRSSQWSEVPTLASRILETLENAKSQIISDEIWATDNTWSRDDKSLFLTEATSIYILLGRFDQSKELLKEASQASGLLYSLSGALGKRTRFQENSTSQLVVLARSRVEGDTTTVAIEEDADSVKPDALQLNNDTLLEEIDFSESKNTLSDKSKLETLPSALAELAPDNQPQLQPLDQIILLTEATLKDVFSPIEQLTSEEVLPFATRVITDKSSNWQIYTQALLVRSRIEIHRSRTMERGVLQMQVLADQVLTDTTGVSQLQAAKEQEKTDEAVDAPVIQITAPGQDTPSVSDSNKPTTFLPAPKASESAPAHIRLQYIHALSAPPRWHLESELAYSWAGVGSLVSALEIFKRLRLWAEVALCLATNASSGDEEGRGSGGDDKARGIIRWRLFNRSGNSVPISDADDEIIEDATRLKAADFSGPERIPSPPNAPRLWCILGDLENDPAHYERAWEVSNHRYARAQKSLGEYYLQNKEWEKAHDAYKMATAVNRLSPEMWSRLGDISLRLARFQEAAEAFSRSIGSANDTDGGEDARTWSNMGSALYSLYCEVMAAKKDAEVDSTPTKHEDDEDEDEDVVQQGETSIALKPSVLLAQSLAAYKKGASIAHDNWRIWDNVMTLASRIHPVPVADMVLALKNIIRIRKTEDVIDADVLSALLQDAVLSKDKLDSENTIYEPPRGSLERLVARIIEEEVVPVITQRAELWALVSRLRAWRRDYEGVIEASERAWRAAVGTSGSGGAGLLPGELKSSSADWTSDERGWAETVKRTDELVSVLENWGPSVESVGPKWRGKARSAVRSVMGRAKTNWEGSEGWTTLEGIMEGLKVER